LEDSPPTASANVRERLRESADGDLKKSCGSASASRCALRPHISVVIVKLSVEAKSGLTVDTKFAKVSQDYGISLPTYRIKIPKYTYLKKIIFAMF